MGRKFFRNRYYKHEDCVNAFIYVEKVSFDENGTHATVHAYWLTQDVDKPWFSSDRVRINIKPDHYNKWHIYEPKGDVHV